MENAKDLNTVSIRPEDDDMTLVGIAEEPRSNFWAFVPERLIVAQPLQTCCDRGSVTARLLVTPMFPCVPTDLGQISKCRPRQSVLHYPVLTELSAPLINGINERLEIVLIDVDNIRLSACLKTFLDFRAQVFQSPWPRFRRILPSR